jgi:hypothetical protein
VPPAVASALPQRRHIRRDIAGLVAGQFMFGILACGSRRNVIRPFSLKFGRLAISSNGGAPAFASRCMLVTTWQDAHQRCASRSPLEGSAPNAGCAMAAINIAKAAALIDGDVVVFIAEPHVAGRQKKHTAKRCRNEKSQHVICWVTFLAFSVVVSPGWRSTRGPCFGARGLFRVSRDPKRTGSLTEFTVTDIFRACHRSWNDARCLIGGAYHASCGDANVHAHGRTERRCNRLHPQPTLANFIAGDNFRCTGRLVGLAPSGGHRFHSVSESSVQAMAEKNWGPLRFDGLTCRILRCTPRFRNGSGPDMLSIQRQGTL